VEERRKGLLRVCGGGQWGGLQTHHRWKRLHSRNFDLVGVSWGVTVWVGKAGPAQVQRCYDWEGNMITEQRRSLLVSLDRRQQ
jgi:hypothetical protein